MNKRIIVFDLDGTLLDTLKDLNEASNYALKSLGFNEVTLLETKEYIGNGIKKLIERSLKENSSKTEEVLAIFKEYYFNHFDIYTKPYDGIMELLDYCRTNSYKMAVLSNKAQRPLELLCEKFFAGYFEVIIGDRPDIKKKPSLMGLDYICDKLDCSYSDIVYIGDGDADYETANKANCSAIYVDYGFRGRKYLESLGAKVIVDTPFDIIKLLEE